MKLFFYAVTILYAILSIFASVTQYERWKETPSLKSMMSGGIGLVTSLLLKSNGFRKAILLVIASLVCISFCAWQNEKKQKKTHLLHHVVRLILSVLIVIGFLFY